MSTTLAYYIKDPQSVLDYQQDWTKWLGSDIIALATASAEIIVGDTSPLEIEGVVFADKVVTVWITGGTAGNRYAVTVEVTTSTTPVPRVEQRSFLLEIKHL